LAAWAAGDGRDLISSATVPCPIEKTWKPPESVMIGRSQRMKRCSPPSCAISSWPGVRNRWNVFPSTMSNPSSAASRTSSVFTTALVASGTKAGVRSSPWASRSVPVRARPARACMSKGGARPPRLLALDGLLAAGADLDAARLLLLGLRDAYLEHAAGEVRGDGLGIDALREGQRPREGAERPLDAVVALGLGLVLGLALARDGQRAVL